MAKGVFGVSWTSRTRRQEEVTGKNDLTVRNGGAELDLGWHHSSWACLTPLAHSVAWCRGAWSLAGLSQGAHLSFWAEISRPCVAAASIVLASLDRVRAPGSSSSKCWGLMALCLLFLNNLDTHGIFWLHLIC